MEMPDLKIVNKGAIAWMAGNPVAANLMMFIFIIGGLVCFTKIKQEVFPEFSMDFITVSVAYSGASPEEVEQGIILVVEENVRGLDGVKEITSRANEGSGTVFIELLEGVDTQKIYQDVKQEIDRITTFPDDAEEPVVSMESHKRDVLDLAFYGEVSDIVLNDYAEMIRDRLLQADGITQVELSGVRDHEISVSLKQNVLRKYNLTIDDVVSLISTNAIDLPGGSIKTDGGEILVRMKERRDTGIEFADLPVITLNDGTVVLLKDVAEIVDGFEESDSYNTYNGYPSVTIDVYRIGDQTPIGVSKAARKVVDEIQKELPPTLHLTVRRDRSDIFRQRAELLLKNGAIGLCLVMVILGLFLEIRLAFWVMMGIPISFVGALLFLPVYDQSINMISMFAFLLALGIVVDDAIVVGENVYEHRQRGDCYLTASILGTREVAIPVTFSVLTNIVTFLPLMFLPGFIGKIWFVIPTVVCTVFAISLVECLYILPAHLSHSSVKPKFFLIHWIHVPQQAFSKWFSRMIKKVYKPILEFLLRNRYAVSALGFTLLILTLGYVNSNRIGKVPMMKVEADFSVVSVALPYGSPLEETEKVGKILEEKAREVGKANGGDQLLVGIMSRYGGSFRETSGSHNVQVRAYLTGPDVRPISTVEFTRKWRKAVGTIPGVEAMLFQADRGGPGSGATLSLQLSHSDSAVLDKASAEFAAKLEEYPIVSDVDDGFSPGKVQFDFKMRPEGLALGLTAVNVARQVRNAFYGSSAVKQQRGRNEVEVKVRYVKSERVSEYDLENFLIRTPSGTYVPIKDVAYVTRGRAYTSIQRDNGKRITTVSCNVTPASESENVLADVKETFLPELQEKYPGLEYGFSGRQKDWRESMSAMVMGFIIAVLAIYALLAIPFRSYTQPLIIMICIPFGIVGAIWAHVMMGYPLTLISIMGIVALSGVVVNDSLVLIDFANGERKRGADAHDAICNAGIRRFRPIMLTTITTFCGLAPMIFETSRQARFMIPMAISLGYGIVCATTITLILVPCLYMIIDDMHKLVGAIFGTHTHEDEVPDSNPLID